MTISALIKTLQKIKHESGDLDVWCCEVYGTGPFPMSEDCLELIEEVIGDKPSEWKRVTVLFIGK